MTDYTKDDLRRAFLASRAATLYRGNLYADLDSMDEKSSDQLFERWHEHHFE